MAKRFELNYKYGTVDETIDIREPINWDKVTFVLDRDEKYFGVNYQYTDGDIQLMFAVDHGVDKILETYSNAGSDGEIFVNYYDNEVLEYKGKLNLNSGYKLIDGVVSATLSNSGFNDLVNSRLDTKIDLLSSISLDGVTKTSIVLKDMTALSQAIENSLIVNNNDFDSISGTNYGVSSIIFTPELNTAETDTFNCYTASSFSEIDGPSYGIKFLEFVIPENRVYLGFDLKINIKINFSVNYKPPVPPRPEGMVFALYVIHYDNGNVAKGTYREVVGCGFIEINNLHISSFNDFIGNNLLEITTGQSIHNIDIYNGDYFTISCIASCGNISTPNITQRINYTYTSSIETTKAIEIIQYITVSDTLTKGVLIYDSIKSLCETITSQNDCIVSNTFTDTNKNYLLSTGLMVRLSDSNKLKMSISANDLFTSLQAIFGIGIGYEYINGVQKIVFERLDYFFNPIQIINLGYVNDLETSTATEYLFNEINIGYDKFLKEAGQYRDETNTQLIFSTPIKTNKKALVLISKLVSSGYAYEYMRRIPITGVGSTDETRKESGTFDEDLFINAVVSSGNSYTSENTSNGGFIGYNMLSPETRKNLRITPRRNLENWREFINSSVFFKGDTEKIYNTTYELNGNASTNNGINTLVENDDITLSEFGERAALYIPIWYNFKKRLSKTTIELIKNSLTGRNSQKRNGYITIIDDNGDAIPCWIWSMKYNPNNEEVHFKCLKAGLNRVTPEMSCSDYASFTFEDFENEIDLPSFIENCTFANFN